MLARLRSLWRDVADREHVERDLDDELRAYVDLLAAEKAHDGMAPHDARRAALAEVGSVERVKERVRAARVDRFLYTALPDLRHALRRLRRAPVFATVAVATLTLGIGGTAGIFAVADAALLRPPAGVREPERLVTLQRVQARETFGNFAYPDFVAFRDRARALAGVAGYRSAALAFRGGGERPVAERVRGNVVTGDYFRVLGARAALGRVLGGADDRPAAAPAVVLANGFWRRAFGADPRVVGDVVTLNGRPFTVVGVAAPGFAGVAPDAPPDVWVPMPALATAIPTLPAGVLTDRAAGWLAIVGRLRDGASIERAESDLRVVAAGLAAEHPATNGDRTVRALRGVGLGPDDRAEVGRVLGVLAGAVVLVLAATCVNVAGLLLARTAARRREVAMRMALGATRGRLFRQIVAEGIVLALLAAAPAVALAWIVAGIATALQPGGSPLRALAITPDWRLLAFAVSTAIVCGLLLALGPAVRASRAAPAGVLADTSPRAGGRRARLQRALVAAQVAVSTVLLVATGITLGAVHRALAAGPGFAADGLALAYVDLGTRGYDASRGERFHRALLERLRALPGARDATLAKTMPPLDWSDAGAVFHPGTEPPRDIVRARERELGLYTRMNRVGPHFFSTLRVPLRHGRDFDDRDDSTSTPVAVVSERLARTLWPGENPLGRQLAWPNPWGPTPHRLTIVGVAADIRYLSLTEEPPPVLYLPVLQAYDARATFAVRAARDPGPLVAEIAAAVRALDPELAVTETRTMRQHLEVSLWRQRTASVWVGAFGALAVLLTALGLYGVAAQAVEQRGCDYSVRLALGAPPSRVARRVLGDGLALAGAGLAIGLPAALGAATLVRATLAGVDAPGVALPAAAALLLFGVTLGACALPARRAARANPSDALRAE